MHQCVNDNVQIFDPTKKKKSELFFNMDDVKVKWKVPAYNLLYYRAMMGDKSDNISPVIDGSATVKEEVRRICGLRPVPDIDYFLKEYKSLTPDQRDKFIENYGLMRLVPPPQGVWEVTPGRPNPFKLRELFEELEFKSLMKFIQSYTGVDLT